MKFEVARNSLAKAIQLVSGVVERRQTLPILANVRIAVDKQRVALTGTDLELEMVARCALPDGSTETGETTVPARKLADIWRSLNTESATLTTQADRLVLRSGRTRFTLSTRPASEFPVFESGESLVEVSLPAADLANLLNRTSFSMAQQDVRYFLNGLLLEFTSKHIRAVSTDGHRLALTTYELPRPGQATIQGIVPRKAVHEIARLLADQTGPVTLVLGANFLRLTTSEYSLTTKLVDGKFPDYEKVIPMGGQRTVLAEREGLRQALGRVAIMSNEKYRRVSLTVSEGNLTVQANNPEQEEAEESLAVEAQGDPLEIGFNVGYLQDVLGAIASDQVRLTLGDASSSALIDSPGDANSLYVVMPMRL